MMRSTIVAFLCFVMACGMLRGEDEFEKPPISYSQSVPENRISALQTRLDSGKSNLAFDDAFGYLPALLNGLGIDPDSQMLVFSKTSMQRGRISPRTPRALYFDDDAYVGYCADGDVLEISVADSQLGTVFYTLVQTRKDRPRFERETDRCLQCHGTSRTNNEPGHVIRSLFVDAGGLPILSEGSHQIDYRSPLKDRWGGWYVTGKHGAQTHLGNLTVRDKIRPIENAAGQNVVDVRDRIAAAKYLRPSSDLIALMTFEHQTAVHNAITHASFTERRALHYQAEFNRMLNKSLEEPLESTTRRIANASEALVAALLFVDEAPLAEPISGTTDYAKTFAARGPHDAKGRSLRDFDLRERLFKYPCSYLIYSPTFDALPALTKQAVGRRMHDILTADSAPKGYEHLSNDDRRAIHEILRETKPDLLQPPPADDARPIPRP